MSQLNTGGKPIKAKPTNNIYTVLVLIAFVALSVAVGVVWYSNIQLTGDEQKQAHPDQMTSPLYLTTPPEQS